MFIKSINKGFTLIELLVALTILALIATSAAPMMQITVKRNKEKELRHALWQIRDALDAYKQAADEGKVGKSPDATGYPPALNELIKGVVNNKDPKKRKIYFLRQIPRDPFNTDETLSAEATWSKRSYRQSINELEESNDVYDVHSTSNAIGLNSVPYHDW